MPDDQKINSTGQPTQNTGTSILEPPMSPPQPDFQTVGNNQSNATPSGPGAPPAGGDNTSVVVNNSDGGNKNKFLKTTVVALLGVLILVGGTVAGLRLVQQPQDIRERAYEIALEEGYMAKRAPLTPGNITATCLQTGQAITPNSASSCPDPEFSWVSQAEGFSIYFDSQSPVPAELARLGSFQTGNTYSPTNLQPGTTYFLAVTETDSDGVLLWETKADVQTFKPGFIYTQQ